MNKKEMMGKLAKSLGRGCAPGTLHDAASVLDMNINQFTNRLYGKKEQDLMFKHLETLTLESGDPAVAEYFASLTGHVVVELPDAAELDSQDLYECELEVRAHEGQLNVTIYEAGKDGVFDKAEIAEIERLEKTYISALLALDAKKKALYTEAK